MNQEHEDYADPEPPRPPDRPPSLAMTLALIVALTVLASLLICGGLLFLLVREAGPK